VAVSYRALTKELYELLKKFTREEEVRAAHHAQFKVSNKKLPNKNSDKIEARYKFLKRMDVVAKLRERNEERRKNQAEGGNRVRELQEKIEGAECEVAILRRYATDLEKRVEEQQCSINQVKKKTREKRGEMLQKYGIFLDMISGFKKKMEEKDSAMDQIGEQLKAKLSAEATLRREKEAMEIKIDEKDTQIEELGRMLQEQMNIRREEKCKWNDVLTALYDGMKQVEKQISVKDSDREKRLDSLACHIKEQVTAPQDKDCGLEKVSEELEAVRPRNTQVINCSDICFCVIGLALLVSVFTYLCMN
jgi:SMC interacting uncharacterized protein involved in chromosome segregation